MVDNHHRRLTYLRLSLTDRCNLRCRYCMPPQGLPLLPHREILTYEEMLRLVGLFVGRGVNKIRVTGGEPLLRRGLIDFLSRLKGAAPGVELCLTTNGLLLGDMASALRQTGISRVNVSLDSLDRRRYRDITRRDALDRVLAGIDASLETGFDPVKINMVPLAGVNDDEIADFGRLSLERPLVVRFIEFMPLGDRSGWRPEMVVPTEEVMNRLKPLGGLEPIERRPEDGPARRFRIKGAPGEVGFISAMTDHFCPSCNRLRVTAEGRLRPCLLSDAEVDLKAALRDGRSDAELAELLTRAAGLKPRRPTEEVHRPMSSIGG
ncbi:MAG: GTP 3',8-cyclase MoaA [Proteobacteria bacterium]|nr:GTP 3',8-cyclase MoaA [Pseudomonadota bacterium]MBU1742116.1 GTP 3',8-cyclase MoaA [Pseudomonadota bacterium]